MNSNLNFVEATTVNYKPFAEYLSWGTHQEVFCVNHGSLLRESTVHFFLYKFSTKLCQN